MKNFVAELLVAALFAAMVCFVLAEWLAGCGETWVDAAGVRHANKCLFINN